VNRSVELCDLSVGYADENTGKAGREIIRGLNAQFHAGEIACLFGANGSGKTTLLKAIAGLVKPNAGRIVYGEALRTRISYMPQDYRSAIFPWLNVDENIAFDGRAGARVSGRAKEIRGLLLPELDGIEAVYNLSGGQQQLVCLSRALCASAGIILLDEPLSAVDAVRTLHALEIVGLKWDIGDLIVIWVTHSIDEGIMAGDRILLLENDGSTRCQMLTNRLGRPRSVGDLVGEVPDQIRREIITALQEL
jgi:ABC-type nitrate/sulfonate/bicarbonate transport system ATPase subunit